MKNLKTNQPLVTVALVLLIAVLAGTGYQMFTGNSPAAMTGSITGGAVIVTEPSTPSGVKCDVDYTNEQVKYNMSVHSLAGADMTGTAYVYDSKPTFWGDERGADDKTSLLGVDGSTGSLASGAYAFYGSPAQYFTHVVVSGYEDLWYEGPVIPECGTVAASTGYDRTFKIAQFDTTALMGAALDSAHTHANATNPDIGKFTVSRTVGANKVVIVDELYVTGIQIDESIKSLRLYLNDVEYVAYDSDKGITPVYGASGYEFKVQDLGLRIEEDQTLTLGAKVTVTTTWDGAATDGDSQIGNGEKYADAVHIYTVEGTDLAAGNDITA